MSEWWKEYSKIIMRSMITIIAAVSWFLFSGYLFLAFLPQFTVYTVFLTNYGVTDNDVYFFWSWIPTLFLLAGGIFWSSGLMGKVADAIS